MKTACLLLFLGIVCTAQGQIKQRNWDVRLGASGGTYPYLQTGEGFLELQIFQPEFEASSYTADVLYKTKWKGVKVGLLTGYVNVRQFHLPEWNWTGGSSGETYVLAKKKFYSFIPVINYTYLNKRHSQLYSQAGFGMAIVRHQYHDKTPSENYIRAAYQGTLLGYRLGDRFGFFGEVGYGYQGILKFGFSETF